MILESLSLVNKMIINQKDELELDIDEAKSEIANLLSQNINTSQEGIKSTDILCIEIIIIVNQSVFPGQLFFKCLYLAFVF